MGAWAKVIGSKKNDHLFEILSSLILCGLGSEKMLSQ